METQNINKKFLYKNYSHLGKYEIYEFTLSELDQIIEKLRIKKEKSFIGWDNYSGRRVEFKEFFENTKIREEVSLNIKIMDKNKKMKSK